MVHHVVVEDVALRVRWYSALLIYWPTATEIVSVSPCSSNHTNYTETSIVSVSEEFQTSFPPVFLNYPLSHLLFSDGLRKPNKDNKKRLSSGGDLLLENLTFVEALQAFLALMKHWSCHAMMSVGSEEET
jgi:hypothetical protein